MSIKFSEKQLEEIDFLSELIELYKLEGLNRLKIWKKLRDEGIAGYILLQAFRKTELFKG